MKFPGFKLGSIFKEVKETPFNSIEGYDDLKIIINRVLSSEESFNLLLIGPSASSKTQFLIEIMKAYKDAMIDLLKILVKFDHGLDAYRLTEELGLTYRACYLGLKTLRKAGLIGGKLRYHITPAGRRIIQNQGEWK